MDESGLPLVLGALLSLAGRLVGPAMGWMREVVRVTCHCVKVTFTDAGILPKLIVAGYRRARGRKRLCAAGVAGNEGRDEDEGGEDFTVSVRSIVEECMSRDRVGNDHRRQAR